MSTKIHVKRLRNFIFSDQNETMNEHFSDIQHNSTFRNDNVKSLSETTLSVFHLFYYEPLQGWKQPLNFELQW